MGCNTKKTKIFGTLKYQGVAIEKGIVEFSSLDGKTNGAKTNINNGCFELYLEIDRLRTIYLVRIWGYKNTGKK